MSAPSRPLPTSSEESKPAYYLSSGITRCPLDTKGLEGSTNTVRETVVELKRLFNNQLRDSIEFSQGLAEAVFPDYNLPFQIDNSLLNGPRTTHNQSRRSLKSVLCQPPAHWSEANTCGWLNDIGENLRQAHPNHTYTNIYGTVVPIKRVWSSAYSSVYMKQGGANNTDPVPLRKPDIIIVDESFNGEISWPQVHALAEVTRTKLIKSRTQFTRSLISCSDPRIIATLFRVYILLEKASSPSTYATALVSRIPQACK